MDIDLELETKMSRRELRLLLLHEFCLGRKAMEATSNTCGTMDKDVRAVRTAQYWFYRFKDENFELNDLPLTWRPLQVDTVGRKIIHTLSIFFSLLFCLIEINLGAPINDILQHIIPSICSVISDFGYLSISALLKNEERRMNFL